MKPVCGSFLAVFGDDTSRTGTTMAANVADFDRFVRDSLLGRDHEIVKLCYACGSECQLYTGSEAREVFFSN